ncbi:MAG: response regulator transcription factor [Clostridia bacterium]|nr:response regulator transcription factor [Clostridia bacterium]
MAKRILIVDDEPSIVKGLRFNLEQQDDYEVDVAYDGEAALDLFMQKEFDLVLLDIMLPKIDGMEVCQRMRQVSDIPIIMLSAKDADMDKIMGLEYGADDYITKPFNILELKARIKTILRRADSSRVKYTGDMIRAGDMLINAANRSVTISGENINLTSKEFDLLYLFASNKGKVYDRESILDIIWKHQGDLRVVDVHIRRLREKIEADPAKPEYIMTKWGIGYFFSNR